MRNIYCVLFKFASCKYKSLKKEKVPVTHACVEIFVSIVILEAAN